MRVIIAGAGDVGFHLATMLAHEKQDIVLIDNDRAKLNYAAEHLDLACVFGNSTSYRVLEDAGVQKANLLISVTNSEEANLSTAIIGKQLGAKKTVARIKNEEYLFRKDKLDLKHLGVDELICPESLAAKEIKRLLKETALTDSFDFDGGKLSLIGVSIGDNEHLVNKQIKDLPHLNPELNYLNVAILRHNETIIPRGDTMFKANDHIYFIAQPNGGEQVLNLFGNGRARIRNMIILGGSKVGLHTAIKLSEKYGVKLIEKNPEKSLALAEELPKTLVIKGDGRDLAFLKSEAIGEMDAFVAVTDNSETNILSCLMAKNQGVPKTIAMVENVDYIHLSQNIGVDTLINKKLIAASFIFRYIRAGRIVSMTNIHGSDAEILEFEVDGKAKILKNILKDLDFPKSAIIGGVIRNNQGLTPMGDFRFMPNDRVVVVTKPECIHKVERYFA